MRTGSVVFALALAAASPAAADPVESSRSPVAAGALSIGVTAAGATLLLFATDIAPYYDEPGHSDALRIGVVAGGVALALVGPTTGHLYAGKAWNPALKWRLIGGGVAAVTFYPAFATASADPSALAMMLGLVTAAGGAVYVGAMVYEIATAPSAARGPDEPAAVSIAPLFGSAPGIAVAGRF